MRTRDFTAILKRRRIAAAVIFQRENVRALTGVEADDSFLKVEPSGACLYTDFRYAAELRRTRPDLEIRDVSEFRKGALPCRSRIGYEGQLSHSRFLKLGKISPGSAFVDVSADVSALRSVKTSREIAAIAAAERITLGIWKEASRAFSAGMTEKDMARMIRSLAAVRADGEAFKTIVSIGANAAECHHVPDSTVWNGREPVLVDMGVVLDGVCSDLTRNLVPKGVSKRYRSVLSLVKKANRSAIAAARPGMTCRELDAVARGIIAAGGYGEFFGHSLGHGVGYEIHEAPTVSPRSDTVLSPGMVITVEPGIYLEGELGVRVEDLVLITEKGCRVLSR